MANVLVYCEQESGNLKKSSYELLSKAQNLASNQGGQVIAVVIGENAESTTAELGQKGAHKVIVVKGLSAYSPAGYAQALADVILQNDAKIVLGSASAQGKDFFPRLSAKIKAGLASDVVGLDIVDGKLIAKKPVYSGKALTQVSFKTDVQLVTVRPNSLGVTAVTAGTAQVSEFTATPSTIACQLVETVKGEAGTVDLSEAEIIVSGGRALGSADNFKILRDLASVVHASVGASRAAVDSGYASHDMQVGQTGKVVNPKLYIACGISGAIQHLAGMRTSKIIVAINKDPEAPIFSKADYGIVGDLFQVVPLLTEELKKVV